MSTDHAQTNPKQKKTKLSNEYGSRLSETESKIIRKSVCWMLALGVGDADALAHHKRQTNKPGG